MFLFCISINITAQNKDCDCIKELDFVAGKLKKVPSFRSQMKGRSDVHQKFIALLEEEIRRDKNISLNCIAYLQKYLTIIKDRHLYIVKQVEPVEGDFNAFYQRMPYRLTPFYDTPSEELIANTENDNDPLTTVYRNMSESYTIAVIKDPDTSGEYLGILLSSNNKYWKKGQLRFILKKTAENKYDHFEYNAYHYPNHRMAYFKEGVLYPNRWIPKHKWSDYKFNPYARGENTFDFKELSATTNYLYLGSFNGSNANKRKADSILAIASKYIGKKSKLILDVRNNTGGGIRTYQPFIDALQTYKGLTIYLIQNTNCASACEQFILKLKAKTNTILLGEATKGVIAYGYGNGTESYKTPCFGYKFQPTRKKFEKYLEYETTGIPADLNLDFKSDWVSQVLQYANNN